MMAKRSAGLLVYRIKDGLPEVFLGHPGGPFWAKKDLGVWSIPKGEFETEKPLDAAKREFLEETGFKIGRGKFIPLAPVKQKSGKMVFACAVAKDLDPEKLKSNTFVLKFPGSSGPGKEYPELDRAAWFGLETAMEKVLPYQIPLIVELKKVLSAGLPGK
jgi:predicted NUDIX family NTP pyrophosphohydrolase